jgi:hypothetical protein
MFSGKTAWKRGIRNAWRGAAGAAGAATRDGAAKERKRLPNGDDEKGLEKNGSEKGSARSSCAGRPREMTTTLRGGADDDDDDDDVAEVDDEDDEVLNRVDADADDDASDAAGSIFTSFVVVPRRRLSAPDGFTSVLVVSVTHLPSTNRVDVDDEKDEYAMPDAGASTEKVCGASRLITVSSLLDAFFTSFVTSSFCTVSSVRWGCKNARFARIADVNVDGKIFSDAAGAATVDSSSFFSSADGINRQRICAVDTASTVKRTTNMKPIFAIIFCVLIVDGFRRFVCFLCSSARSIGTANCC